MTDQFAFLKAEWPEIHEAAVQAAAAAHPDPRTACFNARRALELLVNWAFKFDASLRTPYDDNLSALIHEPTFRTAAGPGVFQKARLIKDWGNAAVHSRPIKPHESLGAVRELFHVCYWFARTYARGARPAPTLAFNPDALPKTSPLPLQTVEQLRRQETELQALRAASEKHAANDAANAALTEELKAARAETALIDPAARGVAAASRGAAGIAGAGAARSCAARRARASVRTGQTSEARAVGVRARHAQVATARFSSASSCAAMLRAALRPRRARRHISAEASCGTHFRCTAVGGGFSGAGRQSN